MMSRGVQAVSGDEMRSGVVHFPPCLLLSLQFSCAAISSAFVSDIPPSPSFFAFFNQSTRLHQSPILPLLSTTATIDTSSTSGYNMASMTDQALDAWIEKLAREPVDILDDSKSVQEIKLLQITRSKK